MYYVKCNSLRRLIQLKCKKEKFDKFTENTKLKLLVLLKLITQYAIITQTSKLFTNCIKIAGHIECAR